MGEHEVRSRRCGGVWRCAVRSAELDRIGVVRVNDLVDCVEHRRMNDSQVTRFDRGVKGRSSGRPQCDNVPVENGIRSGRCQTQKDQRAQLQGAQANALRIPQTSRMQFLCGHVLTPRNGKLEHAESAEFGAKICQDSNVRKS